jgi:HSP20 family molecular chaperone IbpA
MAETPSDKRVGTGDEAESTRNVPLFRPPTDIYETDGELVLLLEMPGVDPGAIQVTLDKRMLTIVGHGQFKAPEGATLAHAEYREGDYERSFTLSTAIDAGGIEASAKDGVLRVRLPKTGPAPAKTIHVKAD